MRKTFVAITAFAVVPLGAAGCVSKSEYTKTVQTAEARYSALDAENTRLKSELANAGKRNEQLTADRAELERTLTMKSGELGKSVADLRQRVSALEGDNARLTQDLAEAQKTREEKVREVSSTYALPWRQVAEAGGIAVSAASRALGPPLGRIAGYGAHVRGNGDLQELQVS